MFKYTLNLYHKQISTTIGYIYTQHLADVKTVIDSILIILRIWQFKFNDYILSDNMT